MKRSSLTWFLSGLLALSLSACGRLDTVLFDPPQTPETWLQVQPFADVRIGGLEFVLIQPSTSAIVYLLGLLTIGAGLYFLKIRAGQRSRLWWGIALLLWGVGALLAGTSYEAFSYAIKCAGRESCLWTSWWEIGYLLVSVWSIDAMVLAGAFSCVAAGKWRSSLSIYALVNAGTYLIVLLVGIFVPVKFLISFELLLAVSAPGILALFGLSLGRYLKFKTRMDLSLFGAWIWLGLTIGAYFLYYISGTAQTLWARGVWFTENDLLHIGLILWMYYLVFFVARVVVDLKQTK